MGKILFLAFITCLFIKINIAQSVNSIDSVKFICNELLGRPTNSSITINMCADNNLDVYVEYGTQSSIYTGKTTTISCLNSVPFNLLLNNLLSGITYYYRVMYRITGTQVFLARDEHSFKTAKPKGTTFTFAVEADPHLDYNTNLDLYKLTLSNIANNNPDILIDLGDTFMSDKLQSPTQDSITYRHLLLRSYYDLICHSIPLFLVLGNHEGEQGWLLNSTANNLAVMASNTRTKYYINPVPDNFYSGDSKSEDFVGLRENYYSWEWGNALFVVLDPYWYTKIKPGNTVDNWSWTLGEDQYEWFKNVLESSSAKFKFVFCHQLIGGHNSDGRGGAESVPFYEMGGLNADSTWGFTINRPGWELPIHQLMVQNHVSIFFHGHDHLFDEQELDGIIYQEVPQPGNPNFQNTGASLSYGYVSGKIIPCSGFLKVIVSDSSTNVAYVRSYLPVMENQDRTNGHIDYSYTINSNTVAAVEKAAEFPLNFSLMQNYPNPFNPSTIIKYEIPVPCTVQLIVYDILGRELVTLLNQYTQKGTYNVLFNAQKYSLAGGIYFYRISADNYTKCMKMIYLK